MSNVSGPLDLSKVLEELERLSITGMAGLSFGDVQVDYADIGAVVPYPSLLPIPLGSFLPRAGFAAAQEVLVSEIARNLKISSSEISVAVSTVEEVKIDGYVYVYCVRVFK